MLSHLEMILALIMGSCLLLVLGVLDNIRLILTCTIFIGFFFVLATLTGEKP